MKDVSSTQIVVAQVTYIRLLEVSLPKSNDTNPPSQSGVCMMVKRQGARLATILEREGGALFETGDEDLDIVCPAGLGGHSVGFERG
jgi:hypothetical protein